MRLGGPVFDVPAGDSEAWVARLREAGYRAAYCPLSGCAADDVVKRYRDAAARAGILIAEVGAWSNPLDPDPARARALGLDVADEPAAPPAPLEDGPFLRPASAIREQDFTACHGGAGAVRGRHVIERRDALTSFFVHDDILLPGVSIGEHRHEDEEIYYVLEGHGTMILDGVGRPMGPGDVSVVQPGHTHGLVNDGAQPLRLLVIGWD